MVWYSLPDDLRAQQDYESFRQGLKTLLFSMTDNSVFSALETSVIIALINLLLPYHILYHTIPSFYRFIIGPAELFGAY